MKGKRGVAGEFTKGDNEGEEGDAIDDNVDSLTCKLCRDTKLNLSNLKQIVTNVLNYNKRKKHRK